MEALFISTGVVALAEIGDKTQLLSLLLAARYRRPKPIMLGILVATLANHALASAVGAWLASLLPPDALRWIVGFSFIAMALWMLRPDKLSADDTGGLKTGRFGLFGLTLIIFFMAEMGDKTQIATVALAAQFSAFTAVVAGTTLGMMIANVPAVLLGQRLASRLPLSAIRIAAMLMFATLGIAALLM